MQIPKNTLKSALAEGRPQIGLWVAMANSVSTDIVAGAGFDFILLDGEHAPNDVRSLLAQLQTAAAYPVNAVVRATIDLLRDAGKTPVHVRRDVPGFVGNRLQHAMKREAVALVAAGVCDAETIDIVVREGFGARSIALGPRLKFFCAKASAAAPNASAAVPINKRILPGMRMTIPLAYWTVAMKLTTLSSCNFFTMRPSSSFGSLVSATRTR